jgi:hypothetical protein
MEQGYDEEGIEWYGSWREGTVEEIGYVPAPCGGSGGLGGGLMGRWCTDEITGQDDYYYYQETWFCFGGDDETGYGVVVAYVCGEKGALCYVPAPQTRFEEDMCWCSFVDQDFETASGFEYEALVKSNPRYQHRLKFWTPEICLRQPHLFDFVITVQPPHPTPPLSLNPTLHPSSLVVVVVVVGVATSLLFL